MTYKAERLCPFGRIGKAAGRRSHACRATFFAAESVRHPQAKVAAG